MSIFKKIKDKLQNKEAKTLLENFISLSVLQLVGMILPLITLPYVLRVLGFEKYGIIVFAASLITYFQSLTDFSFRITAVRDVAIFKNSPQKLNLIYSKVIWVKVIFLLLSLLIIMIIVLCVSSFYEYKQIYALTSLMLIGYALFPEWFFQGIEKMRYITYLNIGIKLVFTICIFVFIRTEADYWMYPLLQGTGLIGAGIVGQYLLIKKYKLQLIWLPKRIIIDTIKSNFPLFVNQFVPTLYNNTGTFVLGILTNSTLVGIYSAIKIVTDLCLTLLGILSRVFFPYLNRNKFFFPKYAKMVLVLSLSLCLLSVICHPLIFWYLNIDYEHNLLVLVILSIGLIGYSMTNIYGTNFFIIKRKDRLVMLNTLQYAILGIVLVYPLVKYLGIIGAALNLTIVRLFMGVNLFINYKMYIQNEKNNI